MSFIARATVSVLVALALIAPRPAAADFVCTRLDVPGSSWTQVWQVKNSGQVVAGSDIGGHTYSGGAWTALPSPPANSGYGAGDLNALGINDSGAIAGIAFDPVANRDSGFLLSGGTYSFFSYLPQTYLHTDGRALSNSRIVLGWAYHADFTGPAFLYNPGGVPPYAAGFTEIVPTLNGVAPSRTIPGAMNSARQFVGTAEFPTGRRAFVYDPGALEPFKLFQVEGRRSAARGINDNGAVTGFTANLAGTDVGFLLTSGGYQLFTCPELAPVGGLLS